MTMTTKRKSISAEEVLVQIRTLQDRNKPLNASYIMTNQGRLYSAARKHYNSWEDAITTAGLDYSEINLRFHESKWSKEEIIDQIIELYNSGVCLKSDNIQKEHTKLHSAAQRYFDSWGDAVNQSGYDYEEIKGIKWTELTVISEIVSLHTTGVDLSSSSMQKENMDLFQAGCRIFGSWKQSIEASGLNYSEHRKQNSWTRENVREEILEFLRVEGTATAGIISKKNGALYQAGRRLFKSFTWKEIVDLCIQNPENFSDIQKETQNMNQAD